MRIMPLIVRIVDLCLYVSLVSVYMEPANSPISKNGSITPRQKTVRIIGKVSEDRSGRVAKKMGAMHGSRK